VVQRPYDGPLTVDARHAAEPESVPATRGLPVYALCLARFWATSFAAEAEYRLNFVLAAIASVLGLGGNCLLVSLLYSSRPTLAGWAPFETLMVVAAFTIMQGAIQSLFTPNLAALVQHVRSGTLDFILMKPIDSQFWLSSRLLSPWGLPDAVAGMLLFTYCALRLDLNLFDVGAACAAMALSMLALYALWFLLASATIIFVKVFNITIVFRTLLDAGRLPIDAMAAGGYRFFFTFVVPVGLLTTAPANAALGRATWTGWLCALAVVGLTLATGRLSWRFALKRYASASS
jgi:ABC-2 type transport system permease protein